MTETSVPPRYLLLIPLGFVIWSVGFIALYATNAIGCAFAWDDAVQRGVLITMALGFLALSGGAAWGIWRYWARVAREGTAPAPSIGQLGTYCAISALLAGVGVFLPSLAGSMCL